MHRTVRLLAGSVVLASIAAALTGCAGGGGSVAGCTPPVGPGQASESVTATGKVGSAPTVSFDTPVHVDAPQVSTLVAGHGAPLTAKQEISTEVSFYNATTGAEVLKSDYTGSAPAKFVIGTVQITGLRKALVCSQVGERLAVVLPPSQAIPAASRPTGLSATDSVVAVIDIRDAYLARANGTDQVMGSGLPAVVLGPDGRPGITLPDDTPPTGLEVANLKVGSGATIGKGDTAVIAYTGVVWKPGDPANGTVFDSSWTTGTPVDVVVKQGQTVPGLVTALAGQKVGSQVLAILPPSQAYGSQSTSTIPANSTLVFVVDILGKA
ncbi:FKBP-type peptidyl-prolyl cis-trans isomerase [Amnibacterium kyonggiense]|uniref:peptidylprolyl isomerase n=1 Tax=Amnibacterium kyonggiense TaxID=595671 RepID=A0A4R7FL39_9MICO|nr:FKBP-type peptidyl-prolyl cis-trans isomerase [Amnibacterium kyonggiense]TDS77077.1 FKBP-type peptidyl-prolyl isomerase-like protein [Amnibacterium kyonggiense]